MEDLMESVVFRYRAREHTIDNCPQCQSPLRKPIKSHKRYTVDIPPVEPEVTEHTVHGY
jgi:hypothetical protein